MFNKEELEIHEALQSHEFKMISSSSINRYFELAHLDLFLTKLRRICTCGLLQRPLKRFPNEKVWVEDTYLMNKIDTKRLAGWKTKRNERLWIKKSKKEKL